MSNVKLDGELKGLVDPDEIVAWTFRRRPETLATLHDIIRWARIVHGV